MANVLLIGINYAPEQTGVAVNTVAMANALAAAGHSVEVFAGMPHYPEWRVHHGYRRRLRMLERIDGVHVRRFGHYVPRRHHTAITRGLYEATFAANAALARPRSKPDAVVGVVPSLGGALLARNCAARFKVPWGIVFSDLLGKAAWQSGMPGGRSVSSTVESIELRLARAATGVAVIAAGFRQYLEGGGVSPERLHRIVNVNNTGAASCPSERDETRRRHGWREDEFVVLHTGNMGYKQALDNIIHAAWLGRHDPRYRFVLMGEGNRRRDLEALATSLGTVNVHFEPLAAASEYPSVLNAADALVLNQRALVTDMSVPGKVSNYLSTAVPVIAAVALDSEAAVELQGTDGVTLVPPEDPAALLAAIQDVAARPARHSFTRSRGGAYANAREAVAEKLDINEFVAALLRYQISTQLDALPAGLS